MRILVLATIALVISVVCCPSLLADEPDSPRIAIRATPAGIVVLSTDRLTETTSEGCDKNGKCGDRCELGESYECGESCVCEKECVFGQGCGCGEGQTCGESCECEDGCKNGACCDRMTCHGLKFRLPPGLPEPPFAVPPAFQPNPFVTEFQVWPAQPHGPVGAKNQAKPLAKANLAVLQA